MKLYRQFINDQTVCFDLGCNIGNRLEILFALNAKKIIAVEPQRKLFRKLERKWKNHQKVHLVNKAVGSSNGKIKLYISEAHVVSSCSHQYISRSLESSRLKYCKHDLEEEVECVTIENLINDYGLPDFCKIDVEGFEYEVLSQLTKPIKIIFVEYTLDNLEILKGCLTHLNKLANYQYNYLCLEETHLQLSEWVNYEQLMKHLQKHDHEMWGDVVAKKIN